MTIHLPMGIVLLILTNLEEIKCTHIVALEHKITIGCH